MPYDPDTFKNLYPFPNREAIRQTIQDKILCGELKLPSDRMLDSKSWIEEQAQAKYRAERITYNESEEQAKKAWQKHQEVEHGFSHLPEHVKQKFHDLIWSRGHSGGYGDMENRYCDWVPIILETYEIGYSSGAHDNR